jgi:hypothetical protein
MFLSPLGERLGEGDCRFYSVILSEAAQGAA